MTHRLPQTEILSIDYEGRGVARVDGKTVFINGALPGETAAYRIISEKNSFNEADAVHIVRASPHRRKAVCPHYRDCGGCALQHTEFNAQVAFKQRIFEDQLHRIGKVFPEQLLPPIYGKPWHYRSRTRLAVFRDRSGSLTLGFRSKRSRRIVNLDECRILTAHISAKLPEIRAGLQKLCDKTPECRLESIEICAGKNVTVINLISAKPLPAAELCRFSGSLNRSGGTVWQLWQQVGKRPAEAVSPKNAPELAYTLPEFALTMPYRPGDFTQINTAMNETMISRALNLLDPRPGERIADLFCGLGNFTLPLARSGADIVGIEGLASLTQRARAAAHTNGINNVQFLTADLFETDTATVASWGIFDKMLLDPPRAGAFALVQALHAPFLPRRIVYVSCNPATFARDAAVLCAKGYRFAAAGIMNMFPHTAHVEAISVFTLD